MTSLPVASIPCWPSAPRTHYLNSVPDLKMIFPPGQVTWYKIRPSDRSKFEIQQSDWLGLIPHPYTTNVICVQMKYIPLMQMTVMFKVGWKWISEFSAKWRATTQVWTNPLNKSRPSGTGEATEEKIRRPSEFQCYRDSVFRNRINKHIYRPRSRKPSEFSQ